MYYEESSRLIERWQLQRSAIGRIDRVLAHAYVAGGTGFSELPLLLNQTALSTDAVEPLLQAYEDVGVIRTFTQLECSCSERYGSDEGEECECGRSAEDAEAVAICYRVLVQPRKPAYDPDQQPDQPDVFVSYRRQDTSALAADIYYFLRGHGYSVFLDRSDIPVGADPARVYLRAVSAARNFVALVSRNYLDSDICKLELAHAARSRTRVIRVNIPPLPHVPADLAWINTPNWNPVEGAATGLTPQLEYTLLAATRAPAAANVADLRRQGCQYLMEQMAFPMELEQLRGRLPWMMGYNFMGLNQAQVVSTIQQATKATDLDGLCAALAPA